MRENANHNFLCVGLTADVHGRMRDVATELRMRSAEPRITASNHGSSHCVECTQAHHGHWAARLHDATTRSCTWHTPSVRCSAHSLRSLVLRIATSSVPYCRCTPRSQALLQVIPATPTQLVHKLFAIVHFDPVCALRKLQN